MQWYVTWITPPACRCTDWGKLRKYESSWLESWLWRKPGISPLPTMSVRLLQAIGTVNIQSGICTYLWWNKHSSTHGRDANATCLIGDPQRKCPPEDLVAVGESNIPSNSTEWGCVLELSGLGGVQRLTLWTRQWTFGLYKRKGISWVAGLLKTDSAPLSYMGEQRTKCELIILPV
jgi:hypothetical protein